MAFLLDLCPQPVHGDGQRMVVNIIFITVPQLFQQSLPCYDISRVGGQKPQQLVFIGRNVQLLPAADSRQRLKIQTQKSVVVTVLHSLRAGITAAQRDLNPPL